MISSSADPTTTNMEPVRLTMDVMYKNTWTKLVLFLLTATPLMSVVQEIKSDTNYCIQHNTYNLYLGQDPSCNVNKTDVFTSEVKFKLQSNWKFALISNNSNEYEVINDFSNFLLAIDKISINDKHAKVISRKPSTEDDANIWIVESQPSFTYLKNKFTNQYLSAQNGDERNRAFTKPLAPDNQDLFKWHVIDCSTE